MRAGRLVSILLMLQTRGRVTARELAEALEVSVRTIYRDVEALGAAGVPLYGEPGHDGGYRLLDGFRTRLNGLTENEAESLFLTGLPGPAAELGLGAIVTAAQLKLMSALPDELRDRAERVSERFHLDAPGWYRDPDSTPYLANVADAVWNDRRVRLRYLRWERPRELTREVDPLGLVLKGGHWYLVGRTGDRVRTYRVSRILELDVTDDRFERPAGFDLVAHWDASLATFDERRLRMSAHLRLSQDVLSQLHEFLDGAAVRAAQATARTAAEEDGWVEVTIPVESVDQAVLDLLRLGAEAEVIGPPELRARMSETVAALAVRYSVP
ncbi:helix-turn-helix transcriptional regulator [Actinomadura rupiterrae]|uniref:helix-turn-helix transcriptional regulator n=1 Tax=Actinomadura rupiterrae TaxID=559627 RepID=UPI0020A29FA2|nr:YafY family protein [Actinomadura rupiterrae]MCP2337810.1 putative DNA-binding transcriptional regulator YafY [Actinomadura rupiterrae]